MTRKKAECILERLDEATQEWTEPVEVEGGKLGGRQAAKERELVGRFRITKIVDEFTIQSVTRMLLVTGGEPKPKRVTQP